MHIAQDYPLSRAASTDKRWRHHARSLGVNKSILMRGRREKCSNLCDAACHGHGALCIMGGGGGVVSTQRWWASFVQGGVRVRGCSMIFGHQQYVLTSERRYQRWPSLGLPWVENVWSSQVWRDLNLICHLSFIYDTRKHDNCWLCTFIWWQYSAIAQWGLRIIFCCCRFLKLMLGIAVTCPNRQTFISRIGGLDQATQHSLTQSLASFIIIKVNLFINT